MKVRLPYGENGAVEVDVPDRNLLAVLTPPVMGRVPDEARAIRDALANPTGTRRLRDMARPGARAAVIIGDPSRPNIEGRIAPHVIRELRAGGVRDEDVTFVVGTGAHRPATREEIARKLGCLAGLVRAVNHDARKDRMVDLGLTSQGLPVHINAIVAESDVKVAIGVVLPHPTAGYSGGGKAIAAGAASLATIAATHTVKMLDHPKTGLALLDGNPFYEAAIEMARLAGLDFVVNAVLSERDEIVDIVAGDVGLAHRDLVQRTGERAFRAFFPRPADIVIVAVGYPKDANLYHVCAEGICAVAGGALPTPCVKKGGTIIVVSPMDEGIYSQACFRRLSDSGSAGEVVDRLRREPAGNPGEHRAYAVASVLRDVEVVVAQSHLNPEVTRAVHMVPASTVQEALDYATGKHGRGAEILVVANSHRLVPTLRA